MSNIILIVILLPISVFIAAWADRWNQNPAIFWFAALFFLPFGFVQFVDISPFVIFACPLLSAGALVLLGQKRRSESKHSVLMSRRVVYWLSHQRLNQ